MNELEKRFDQWRKNPPRIRDLNAEEAAGYAKRIFTKAGRNTLGARFTYLALRLDAFQPEALNCASDFFRTGAKEDTPKEKLVYSAVALERARNAVRSSGRAFPELEVAHLRLLWEWHFAIYKKDPTAFPTDFTDPTQFTIDELGYTHALSSEIQRIGSAEKAFKKVHTLIGLRAGILEPLVPLFKRVTPDAPPVYTPSTDYYRWLRTEVRTLSAFQK